MDSRHWSQPCPECNTPSPYRISAPLVFCDLPAYISPASGKVIEGRRARIEDFANTGTRPYYEGEMEDAQRAAAREERKLDAAIDESVEQTIGELKNG